MNAEDFGDYNFLCLFQNVLLYIIARWIILKKQRNIQTRVKNFAAKLIKFILLKVVNTLKYVFQHQGFCLSFWIQSQCSQKYFTTWRMLSSSNKERIKKEIIWSRTIEGIDLHKILKDFISWALHFFQVLVG